jgi:hypothetical protein
MLSDLKFPLPAPRPGLVTFDVTLDSWVFFSCHRATVLFTSIYLLYWCKLHLIYIKLKNLTQTTLTRKGKFHKHEMVIQY